MKIAKNINIRIDIKLILKEILHTSFLFFLESNKNLRAASDILSVKIGINKEIVTLIKS